MTLRHPYTELSYSREAAAEQCFSKQDIVTPRRQESKLVQPSQRTAWLHVSRALKELILFDTVFFYKEIYPKVIVMFLKAYLS